MRHLLIVTALACSFCCEDFDNGFEGKLRPEALPMAVCSVDIEQDILDEATSWWNEQVGADLFFVSDVGEITVLEQSLEDAMGSADIEYDEDYHIHKVTISIGYEIAYHRPTVVQVLKHELGHCLGLADDEWSLDLNSIMSDGNIGERLTAADKARVRSLLNE